MRKGLSAFAAVAAAAVVAVPALAADGDLDLTFGDAGTRHVEVGDYEYGSAGNDVAVDAQGRTVIVGEADNGDGPEWGLTRLDADGQLDTSFGYDGIRTDWIGNGGTPYAVALQPDGKIVVAGDPNGEGVRTNEVAVGRYDDVGQFDDEFGEDSGTQRVLVGDIPDGFARALDVAVMSDGDIVVVGYGSWSSGAEQHAVVVRLDPDGSPDDQFGVGGLIHWHATGYTNRAASVTELPDGRIAVGGMAEQENGQDDLQIAVFERNGAYDTDFSADGVLLVDVGGSGYEGLVESIAVDEAGRIVGAGTLDSEGGREVVLVRVSQAGELDGSFGTGGIVRTAFDEWTYGRDLALRDGGRILVAGGVGDAFALLQYDERGALDTGFGGGDGVVTTDVDGGDARGIALTADGTRAVLAGRGSSRFAAARYVLDKVVVEEEPKDDDKPKQDEKPAPQQEQQQAAATTPPAPVVQPRAVARAPRRCTSRRTFTINLRRLGLVRGDAVFRGRKAEQKRLRGNGRTIRVDLRRLAAGRYTVDVVGVRKSGRKVRLTKRYWTCKVRRSR